MKESSYEIVTSSLNFEGASRIPVVPLVGLYSKNISGLSSYDILHDAEMQAKSQMQCQSRFGYDGIFNVMDLTVEAQTLGASVEFPKNAFPYLTTHPLKNLESIEDVPYLIPKGSRLQVFIDTIKIIAEKLKNIIFINSYVIGPFTLAGHLIGIDALMELTIEDDKTANSLVNHCGKIVTPYIEEQVKAGTDNIVILEPSASCSLISPRFFERFSYPYVKSLVKQIQSFDIGATLHICGKTSKILDLMMQTGADILSVDSPVNLSNAKKILGTKATIMGNVDTTTMIDATPEDIQIASKNCIDQASGKDGFILSTSCDMPIEVPEENIIAMVNSVN